jgi:hypothetical protein
MAIGSGAAYAVVDSPARALTERQLRMVALAECEAHTAPGVTS